MMGPGFIPNLPKLPPTGYLTVKGILSIAFSYSVNEI